MHFEAADLIIGIVCSAAVSLSVVVEAEGSATRSLMLLVCVGLLLPWGAGRYLIKVATMATM